ncbi:MAG: hypothetical protein BJ554DRAFT_2707 [Olpidium bornovanus]|uniref:AMP-dependent synthetase/ligase domain-containing protein n=1 Tax=Olpidium bornovanus TaxID=278681 RepID=A0A8H7ZPM6_9FUNG|nr:MAG: hypothetical protein BJ554DRAFT_2707 [Olpidium bornovanus]
MSGLELNTASLVLAALLLLVAFLYSRALEAAEPDVHPLALARQAAVSRVRASSQETAVYRHRLAGSRGVVTLYDAFHEGLNGARNKPYLGRRPVPGAPYTWSYEEISERVTNFGSGLLRLADLRPGQFSKNFLGIFMTWLVADLACGFYGLCACPLYDATGRETVKRILGKTCLTALVTSRKHLAGLLEAKPDAAWLKLLVLVDGDAAAEEEDRAKKLGVELVAFGRVEEIGSANRRPHIPPKPEDVATLCWTGGTTGEPKGAMIMHRVGSPYDGGARRAEWSGGAGQIVSFTLKC